MNIILPDILVLTPTEAMLAIAAVLTLGMIVQLFCDRKRLFVARWHHQQARSIEQQAQDNARRLLTLYSPTEYLPVAELLADDPPRLPLRVRIGNAWGTAREYVEAQMPDRRPTWAEGELLSYLDDEEQVTPRTRRWGPSYWRPPTPLTLGRYRLPPDPLRAYRARTAARLA